MTRGTTGIRSALSLLILAAAYRLSRGTVAAVPADYADRVRRMIFHAEAGRTDMLLAKQLSTFTDDAKVALYAGDIRHALRSAELVGRLTAMGHAA